ncbi:putative alpha/beta hydrolase [Pseudoduganella lurida]|uniref:Putative alpha/beta hydrolase n=1 Tax=Pseudoduganella lurida TaxID=1036180 RepID=A0A562RJS5_9BURK|nr:alpha/beta fold hydrolase [Pseudoduganella lurida]TWI69315.1 putative alpha/beta hydrolase [Pseudoduganella lurida]
MHPEPFHITLSANGKIEGSLWATNGARAVVLLHPGTAVTQRYYEPFARYLVELGLNVVTYDYRGTGRSRPANLRGLTVSMSDWMDDDVGAVTRWAAARFPALPMLAVGHSLGGHALALSEDTNSLRAAVLVASHAGVTASIRGVAERIKVWIIMRVLAPLLCAVLGYMPGRKLGLGEDLPRDVMLQWSHWTTLPRYFFDDPAMDAERRMARVQIPLLVLGFNDDPWANPDAISMLIAPLTNAKIERHQIAPRDANMQVIEHMGFFRKRSAERLWPQIGSWLLDQLNHVDIQPASVAGDLRTKQGTK